MMMKNKKGGISDEVVLFIPRIIFLIAVIFAFVILVKILIVTKIDIKQVEANILIDRLIFSQDGFSYYDEEIGRLHPGIIDIKAFEQLSKNNPNILDNEIISYGSDNPIIAAKITLKQEDNEIIVFYNKDRFDKWEPRILPGIRGGLGSVKSFEDKKYVLVKNEETLTPATLDFLVIS